MQKYVIGHKNPDTDSIVSALAYAELFGAKAARSGEINKETEFVLKKFGFSVPEILPEEEKEVVLVDHNSPEEMAEGLKRTEVVAIVDHHRLGAPSTELPVEVYLKPYGSTATVIFELADSKGAEVSRGVAGLILAGIISDTLNFTSPTTTDQDKVAAQKLNETLGLDINQLASEMFAAKSDISGIGTDELIGKDYKVFDMSGVKIGIGVWETTNPEAVLKRKSEILTALKNKKVADGLDFVLFGAVDILEGATHFLVEMDPEVSLVAEVFEAVAEQGVAKLAGVVSRKKQVVPLLEKHFAAKGK